jgi:hypothetical protein
MVETYDLMMVSNKESVIGRGLALVPTGYIAVQAKCSARQSGGIFVRSCLRFCLRTLRRSAGTNRKIAELISAGAAKD